jgi:hypothetical protein
VNAPAAGKRGKRYDGNANPFKDFTRWKILPSSKVDGKYFHSIVEARKLGDRQLH